MKQYDPVTAQRVWQRVRSSLDTAPSSTVQLPPIPVYTTPPEAWQPPKEPALKSKQYICRPCQNTFSPTALFFVLIWVLLLQKHR